jgi:hypothetical protein
MKGVSGVVLALALLCGCYATASSDQLARRASFDLECATHGLHYQGIDDSTMAVYGCGKQATYIESCDGSRTHALTTCTWILNGNVRPSTETEADNHAIVAATSARPPTVPSNTSSMSAGATAGAPDYQDKWWCTDASNAAGHCDRQRRECERMRAELSAGSNVKLSECYATSVVYCYQVELSGRLLLKMCSATEELCRYGHDHSDSGPAPVSACERTL